MSRAAIRAALETAVAAMSPAIAPSWENATFTPQAGVPYQAINLLFARPDNSETGSSWVEQGFLQITLCYPQGGGPKDADAQADQIRATFRRGLTLTRGGITVLVTRTPEISPALPDADRYRVPVRIPFQASVEAT